MTKETTPRGGFGVAPPLPRGGGGGGSQPPRQNENNPSSASASASSKLQRVTPTPLQRGQSAASSPNIAQYAIASSTYSTGTAPTPNPATVWPTESSTALPPLTLFLPNNHNNAAASAAHNSGSGSTSNASASKKKKRKQELRFPINEECTSLKLSPSGHMIIGAFTDGTLRVFDLTGTYKSSSKNAEGGSGNNNTNSGNGSSSDATPASSHNCGKTKQVCSKQHQQFGAVACQIEPKGVHTSLRMNVDISDDSLFAFAGVLRGSMELVAVYLGDLEASYGSDSKGGDAQKNDDEGNRTSPSCLLDHLTVYRHADAKLRGFGACTRLKTSNGALKYLLFSGIGIKNIHIFSFTPPADEHSEPVWQQLYDCATNGNTIKWLTFRHDTAHNRLLGLSKSDGPAGQKLRVWDLSYEESSSANVGAFKRPSRPPFVEVANSEGAQGILGSFCLCAPESLYNTMSIVSTSLDDLDSSFNHSELALPVSGSNGNTSGLSSPLPQSRRSNRSSSGRAQRGELVSLAGVAGTSYDAGHALLELSDGNLAKLQYDYSGNPELHALPYFCLPEGWIRCISVGRISNVGLAVGATALYNTNNGKGKIVVWPLENVDARLEKAHRGFWGWSAVSKSNKPVSDSIHLREIDGPEKDDNEPTLQSISDSIHPSTTSKKEPPKIQPPATTDVPHMSLENKHTPSAVTTKASQPSPKDRTQPTVVAQPAAQDHESHLTPKAKGSGDRVQQQQVPNTSSTVASASTVNSLPSLPVARRLSSSLEVDQHPANEQTRFQGVDGSSQPDASKAPPAKYMKRLDGSRSPVSTPMIEDKKPEVTSDKKTDDSNTAASLATTTPAASVLEKSKLVVASPAAPGLQDATHEEEDQLLSPNPRVQKPSIYLSRQQPERECKDTSDRKNPSESEPSSSEDGSDLDAAQVLCQLSAKKATQAAPEATPRTSKSAVSDAQRVDNILSRMRSPARSRRVAADAGLQEQIRAECANQQAKLRGWLKDISESAAEQRRLSRNEKASSTWLSLSLHDRAKAKLAAEHRAAHVQAAKSILGSAIDILQSVRRAPSLSSLNSARVLLGNVLQQFRTSVDEMIQRQDMEASTLCSGEEVSFSFGSSLFENVAGCFPQISI